MSVAASEWSEATVAISPAVAPVSTAVITPTMPANDRFYGRGFASPSAADWVRRRELRMRRASDVDQPFALERRASAPVPRASPHAVSPTVVARRAHR
jgi:hypothetical protein